MPLFCENRFICGARGENLVTNLSYYILCVLIFLMRISLLITASVVAWLVQNAKLPNWYGYNNIDCV